MSTRTLRIGIAGCGHAARVHLERLLALEGVARGRLRRPRPRRRGGPGGAGAGAAGDVPPRRPSPTTASCSASVAPDALAIFTPHLAALPAGDGRPPGRLPRVHREAALDQRAGGGGHRRAGPRAGAVRSASGHQYRLRPSLIEARRRLADGAIGPLRLVTGVLAQPWLADARRGRELRGGSTPRSPAGASWPTRATTCIDALLWTTARSPSRPRPMQCRLESGLDVVTAAAVRLADGTPATLAVSGVSAAALFELNYYGETGRPPGHRRRPRGADRRRPRAVVDLPGGHRDHRRQLRVGPHVGHAPLLPGRGGDSTPSGSWKRSPGRPRPARWCADLTVTGSAARTERSFDAVDGVRFP